MAIYLSAFLILASLSGILAQEDLEEKVFVFVEESNVNHVILKDVPHHPLTNFTVCARFLPAISRTYAIFSYATKANDNEILIHHDKPNIYSLFMKGGVVTFNVSVKLCSPSGWEHICLSWDSESGLVEFWWNGQPLPRKALMKGRSVSPDASIVLGQEQDSFGGGFDPKQSFVGEVKDVYMWDQVLPHDDMCRVWDKHPVLMPNPIINWRALRYEIKENVTVAPSIGSGCTPMCVVQPLCLCK